MLGKGYSLKSNYWGKVKRENRGGPRFLIEDLIFSAGGGNGVQGEGSDEASGTAMR